MEEQLNRLLVFSRNRRIRIAAPTPPPLDPTLRRLRRVLSGPELTNGRETARFERESADYLGVEECVAVSSCTAGLMLTARCLGLRGEVITPSLTFVATGHSLLWNNLEPKLADCDAETFQIDPASVSRLIGPRTAAILAVHLYGCPAPVDELEAIAARRGLPLIFDGAHAFGAHIPGPALARRGDATVYSLSPTKPLTAGEGGLIATRRPELAGELRRARNYGNGEGYDCDLLGLSARMTEVQAVIASEGLPGVDAGVEKRNELAALYQRRLAGLEGVRLQKIPSGCRSSCKDFAVVVEGDGAAGREALEVGMRAAGVETRRYFDPPLHRQKLYRRFHRPALEPLVETERVSRGVLCLPIHQALQYAQAEAIAELAAAAIENRLQQAVEAV